MEYVAAIVLFGVLIAIHEAGHFLAARWAGMRVLQFSIGFGPNVGSFQRGDTEWRIGLLPLGGYVKIAGMNPGEDVAVGDPGSYASKPAYKRLLVIVAGAAMNYLLAFLITFFSLLSGAVVADPSTTRLGQIAGGMPAEAAGLRTGDTVRRVGGADVETFADLARELGKHKGTPVALEVERGAEKLSITITPTDAGKIGVGPGESIKAYSAGEALQRAGLYVVAGSLAIVQSLVDLVTGKGAGELMGPVGIAAVVAEQANRGARWLLSVAASISLALGFFNLLPIPALDGGRAAFLLVELIRRKPVDARAEAIVHVIGFVVLMGLILLVTVGDVGRLLR